MANFNAATVLNAYSLGTGTTPKQTVDLPNAYPISRIWVRHRATHASSITITQDRVEVLVDGSPVIAGLSGDDLRKLSKWETGRSPVNSSAAADVESAVCIQFGRFPGDPQYALPAPVFQSVQLRYEATLDATPVISTLDVIVEEIVGASTKGMIMRKRSLTSTYSPSASQQVDTKLPLGNVLSNVYVVYADVDNVDGDHVQLGINNFTRRIWYAPRTAIEGLNKLEYGFHDDAIPALSVALDLGKGASPGLDTRGLADVKLRTKAASSGVSGTVRVISEELIALP